MAPFTMYSNEKVDKTLNPKFMTLFLKRAQKTELKELLNVMNRIKTGQPLTILDIGVGNGRIPLLLSKEPIWEKVQLFVGLDNSLLEIKTAQYNIKKNNLSDKVKIVHFNALNLDTIASKKILQCKYDLVICTYFTPGNFKPAEIKIATNEYGKILPYPSDVLNPNQIFIRVFKSAFQLLKKNGKLFMGSIYIDSDDNRKKQEAFYKKCRMKIITTEKDSFTATKEGFWSQRFSDDSLYKHLSWIDKDKIKIIPLDRYNFAEAVILSNTDK
ncbi:MAG: methyltransferase domain-containing protein [Candidatus Daviesbacteria bacterium]|nr:methyltransferase domain-containing protein [Candidatus Daviesbacteria bacterium]